MGRKIGNLLNCMLPVELLHSVVKGLNFIKDVAIMIMKLSFDILTASILELSFDSNLDSNDYGLKILRCLTSLLFVFR